MIYVEQDIPWTEICSFLHTLAGPNNLTSRVQERNFPKPAEGIGRPLPEDFIIRGQMYSQWYFPETWFTDAMVDDEERVLELPSMAETRTERILWLGFRLSSVRLTLSFQAGQNPTNFSSLIDGSALIMILKVSWSRRTPVSSKLLGIAADSLLSICRTQKLKTS
jgi:hypothetical protein